MLPLHRPTGVPPRRMAAMVCWSFVLLGCSHASRAGPSEDVTAVTVAAARYALSNDVPPVLQAGTPICLQVDGRPPQREVLSRLSSGPVQVWGGASACTGPRIVLVQVSDILVSGDSASAHAGVQFGKSAMLQLRRGDGQWNVERPPATAGH